ncbi:malonic semialdehyde reductase [Rhodobacter ferrooxidans]|uniref:Nitroreductase n=1 Tax=Rhodobacter ferrooxidans TaxID=371731 RepID=C8RYV3_9RHOB|nr:malonic semialdehyde reductase [Rhodobacter sp. SW2]EEW25910.1 nitroreductase [Rhodobacter sp. SW2]
MDESAAAAVRNMRQRLGEIAPDGLDLLFRDARTHYGWDGRPVTDATLQQALALAAMGPTAFNQQPLRVIFVRSPAAKARLAPALSAGNLEKTMAAPATAIICFDLEFWRNLPELFPAFPAAQGIFEGNPDGARASAQRNGTLQAGYFILAARALGLDCGPMSGFDAAKVAAAFLDGRPWEVNFLINLGHGDPAQVQPRGPRLNFARMAQIL